MLAALGSPRQQEAPAPHRKRRRQSDAEAGPISDDGGGSAMPAAAKWQRSSGGFSDGGGGGRHSRRGGGAAAADMPPSNLPDGPPAATADEPMSGDQALAARRAVLAVAESPKGAIFSSPVGPEAPGYRRVVKRLMDLGTIAAKLQSGAYTTTGQLLANLTRQCCTQSLSRFWLRHVAERPMDLGTTAAKAAGWRLHNNRCRVHVVLQSAAAPGCAAYCRRRDL